MARRKAQSNESKSTDQLLAEALADAGQQQGKRKRKRGKGGASSRSRDLTGSLLKIAAVVLVLLLGDGVRRESQEFAAKIEAVVGQAMIVRADGTQQAASIELRLADGDLIRTGSRGGVILSFPDGSAVQVDPETEFEVRLLDFARGGRRDRCFMVRRGSVIARVGKYFGANSAATVCTPTAVAAVRGTAFRVSHDPSSGASQVSVAEGQVEFRTPLATQATRPGQYVGATGYKVANQGSTGPDEARRLTMGVGRLSGYEEEPTGLEAFEQKLTNLFDPVLQLLGICPGGWGYNSIDFARRAACMEALRRIRIKIEGLEQAPAVLNPVTMVELGLTDTEENRKELDRIQNALAGRMIDSYRANESGQYEIIARARDKKRTAFRLTAAELVRLD